MLFCDLLFLHFAAMPKTGPQHSFDNFGLHHAALVGDDEGVRHALAQGADVNALDGLGRTVIMCAVAGERYVDGFHIPWCAHESRR